MKRFERGSKDVWSLAERTKTVKVVNDQPNSLIRPSNVRNIKLVKGDDQPEPTGTITNTYQIIEGNFTWHEAKADAEARGGHLATITSEGEQAIINELLPDNDTSLYWMGGADETEEGVWEWITGESFVY